MTEEERLAAEWKRASTAGNARARRDMVRRAAVIGSAIAVYAIGFLLLALVGAPLFERLTEPKAHRFARTLVEATGHEARPVTDGNARQAQSFLLLVALPLVPAAYVGYRVARRLGFTEYGLPEPDRAPEPDQRAVFDRSDLP